MVEGPRPLAHLLAAGSVPVELYHTPGSSPDLVQAWGGSGVWIQAVSEEVIAAVGDAETSQGAIALFRRPVTERIPDEASFLVVAWGLADPGNLGALVRVAAAAGADAVVVVGGTDPFGPKAVRASTGVVLTTPVIQLDESQAVATLAALRLELAVSSPHEGTDYRDCDWRSPVALVVGNEAHGVPHEVGAAAGITATIPLRGGVDSLNVASAAAVIAFEIARQRDGVDLAFES